MSQALPIKEEVKKQLPYGLETTADLLLEYMSRSKDEQQRDTAAFIKASKRNTIRLEYSSKSCVK